MIISKEIRSSTHSEITQNVLSDMILYYKNPSNRNMTQKLSNRQLETPSKIRSVHWLDVKLSKREFECVYFIAHGKSYKEISNILSLSSRTVEQFIKTAMRKTNKNNKTNLASWFWEGFEAYVSTALLRVVVMN